jgi:predicted outer membrane repeat protein
MWLTSRSYNRQSAISGERRRADGFRRHRLVFRPAVAALEDRKLLSTVKVTNNLDRGKGSLRDAITKAHSSDTIVFDRGLDGQTITLTSGELVINKSLTIQGPGAGQLAVSGGNASRVFEVDGAHAPQTNVSLSGLTIADGNGQGSTDPGYGGAIENYGSWATLTLAACTLSGNSANTGGGAIENHYGTLTVSSSTLSGNSAPVVGGAIYNDSGTLAVSNSTFSGNSATSGGAIYDDSGTLTVSSSSLSGNSAAFGGAIYEVGTLTLSNSTLSGNFATSLGGAVDMSGGSLIVSNSTLSDNSVRQGGHGSAIYMGSGNVTVTGCTLTDSASGYGYFIVVVGGGLTVKNSSFHNPDRLYIDGPYTDGGGNTFN